MATYYVDGAVGDDANLGTSEGAGNAWATIQKALDTVAAGDHVYIKASATYNEALTASTTGAANNPIAFEGYTSTPGDRGIITNDGTTGTLANGFAPGSGSWYYIWLNVRWTNFSACCAGDFTGDRVTYFNCRADNSGGDGFRGDVGCVWVQCTAEDNSSHGIDAGGLAYILNCIIADNTADGVELDEGYIMNCLLRSNGGSAVNLLTAGPHIVVGNIIDGDSKDTTIGIYLASDLSVVVANNIIYDCATGIQANTDVPRNILVYNSVYNNTTNYTNCQQYVGEQTGEVTFINEGSEDYGPGSTSAAVANGMDIRHCPNAPSMSGDQANIGHLLQEISTGGGGTTYGIKTGGML
jgi:hypothetical protein